MEYTFPMRKDVVFRWVESARRGVGSAGKGVGSAGKGVGSAGKGVELGSGTLLLMLSI